MAQSSFASSTESEMDPQLMDFLRNRANSFVKWDLIRFFHDNPFVTESAENIARYTGRDPRRIERDIGDLVTKGVLEAQPVTGTTIYRLVEDGDMRQMIEQFVDACHDRNFRVKAINHIIHSTQ